jgi:hypothetical protein
LIENDGALFRGPSLAWPEEVWSVKDQQWKPYTGSVPKPFAWGTEISAYDAEEFMRDD